MKKNNTFQTGLSKENAPVISDSWL